MVTGGFSVGVTIAAPLRGRLIDRRGSRRALPAMVTLSAAALVCIAVVASSAPSWVLAALAAASGAATPPLVASMRLEWQRLLGAGDARLAQAYALESALQTAVFVVGRFWPGQASRWLELVRRSLGPRLRCWRERSSLRSWPGRRRRAAAL